MMQKHQWLSKTATLMAGVLMVSLGYADSTGWQVKAGDPNSEFHYRLPEAFKDAVLPGQADKIKLSAADLQQAASWGLSVSEEQRYLAIMSNHGAQYYNAETLETPAGRMMVSSNYSPVDVLGINAPNDADRQKYASDSADNEFQRLAKFLAYNAAYHKASVSLKDRLNLPILKPFDTAKFSPYNYQPVSLQAHDELMLFVHVDDAVKPIMASLMASIAKDPSVRLNVYFVAKNGSTVSSSDIQAWARHQNLLPVMVDRQEITLNIDTGKYAALGSTNDHKLPVLVLVRDGQSRFVDVGRF